MIFCLISKDVQIKQSDTIHDVRSGNWRDQGGFRLYISICEYTHAASTGSRHE